MTCLTLYLGCNDESGPFDCTPVDLSCSDVPEGQTCPVRCDEPAWTPGACEPGMGYRQELLGRQHVELPEQLSYTENPPASGDHRPKWACWGEYSYLPPTRWLHNLEHGGVALLYHPCADSEVIDSLRELARTRPRDESGPFRWILTPYNGLPTTMAIVTWRWVYLANCLNVDEATAFIEQHYRQAPEDIVGSGIYSEGYLGL